MSNSSPCQLLNGQEADSAVSPAVCNFYLTDFTNRCLQNGPQRTAGLFWSLLWRRSSGAVSFASDGKWRNPRDRQYQKQQHFTRLTYLKRSVAANHRCCRSDPSGQSLTVWKHGQTCFRLQKEMLRISERTLNSDWYKSHEVIKRCSKIYWLYINMPF